MCGSEPAPGRSGFTLIELLVVVAIIAVLAAILVPTISMVRENALVADTAQRMDNVSRALAQLGLSEQGPRVAIQRGAGLGGVVNYTKVGSTIVAGEGATLAYDDPAVLTAPAWRLAFPWGKNRVQPNGTSSLPMDLSLSRINPRFSQTLLAMADLFPKEGTDATYPTVADAYARNRSPKAAWNDRWGNPLVVGCAIYQYTTTLSKSRTQVLQEVYQYDTSIYLAVGAVGPKRPAALASEAELATAMQTDLSAALDALWAQITTVANVGSDGLDLWRVDYSVSPAVNAFDKPPWAGVRKAKQGGFLCLLSAPVEIK